MVERPLEDKRPVGPFVNESCNLMVGFPAKFPAHGDVRGGSKVSNRPQEDFRREISNEFGVERSKVNTQRVRTQGFKESVDYFIYFPLAKENHTKTANEVGRVQERIEDIYKDVLNEPLHANVSVWAGTEDSGKNVS